MGKGEIGGGEMGVGEVKISEVGGGGGGVRLNKRGVG